MATLVRWVVAIGAAIALAPQASAALVTIQPGPEGKDVNIVSGSHENQNFDVGVTGAKSWLISNFNPDRSAGLLQFDLSALAGSVVNSASLVLYQSDNFDPGGTYSVFRITSDWSEESVTFASAPSYDPVAVASITFPASDINGGPGGIPVRSAFRTWDVTSLVQGWSDGQYGNFGMWVEQTAKNPSDPRPTVYFAASDWPAAPGGFPPDPPYPSGTQYRPALIVDVTPVPVPAALPLLLVGVGLFTVFGHLRRCGAVVAG